MNRELEFLLADTGSLASSAAGIYGLWDMEFSVDTRG